MNTPFVSLLAIACYLFAAYRTASMLAHVEPGSATVKRQTLALGAVAILLHGITLYHSIVTGAGFNLSVSSSASLVAWLVVVLLLVTVYSRPVENLAVITLPLAAIALGFERLYPGSHIIPGASPVGLQGHIVLSVLAYSVLTIAALQAIMLALADYYLNHKPRASQLKLLPPLTTMEEALFQLIGVGFALLSAGLIAGFLFVDNFLAQHLLHKTFFSCLAWLLFAVLLWGRYRSGWRGRTAVRYTLAGFVMLMFAFFGTKIVLELILGRA